MPAWLEQQLPFERYMIDVGEYRMHIMEQGRGLPVLLLHGNPSWGYLYRRVAAALKDTELRLIMPDLVGLGFSDKPRDGEEHQLDNHIRWMHRLIGALDIDRCILAVQDWGGAIGVGAVAEHPELDVGLVIMNTVLTPPKSSFRATGFHRFAHTPAISDAAFRLLGFPQLFLWAAQGDRRSIGLEESLAYAYPLLNPRRNAAPLALARMAPDSFAHPSIEPLEGVQRYVEGFEGPAAIVWGDRDPVLGRVRSWMERLFPGAPVTRTQAGHFLQEEVPEEIADAIVTVAAQLDRDGTPHSEGS